uniref:Uncharacterized protein n=1 Tax=Solanum lycopersicum TaxID=4081 RepID=A0A3Q7JCA4_SOLLC
MMIAARIAFGVNLKRGVMNSKVRNTTTDMTMLENAVWQPAIYITGCHRANDVHSSKSHHLFVSVQLYGKVKRFLLRHFIQDFTYRQCNHASYNTSPNPFHEIVTTEIYFIDRWRIDSLLYASYLILTMYFANKRKVKKVAPMSIVCQFHCKLLRNFKLYIKDILRRMFSSDKKTYFMFD